MVVVAVLCLAHLVVVLDVAIVAIALPAIGADLAMSTVGLGWVVTGYTFAFGGGLLAAGRLADRVGHRRVFAAGVALFGSFSLACGLAPAGAALLAARVGQGIGAALVVPAALALLVGLHEGGPLRMRALSWWTAAAAGGGASGWMLGGLITGMVGWRWVFLVNVPICAAVVLLALRVVSRASPARGAAHQPIPVDGGVLRVPGVLPANQVAAVLGAAVTVAMFLCTLHAQDVLHLPPIEAGLLFPPFNISVIIGSALGPRLIAAFGRRATVVLGLSAVVAGCCTLLAIAPDRPGPVSMVPGFLLLGLGSGTATVAATSLGTAGIHPARRGLAAGLLATSTQLGTALGVAAATPAVAGVTAALGGGPDAAVAGYRTGFTGAAALAAAAATAMILLTLRARTRPGAARAARA